MSVQIVIQICQLLHEAVRQSQTNYWEDCKMAFPYFSCVTENEFLKIFHLIFTVGVFFLTKVFNNYMRVRFTHWKRAKGVVRISWGCNPVLANHTKGSIFGPTLSTPPVWHVGEHPPKLRTVFGPSGATECLEWKTLCVCMWCVKYGSFYFRWSPLELLLQEKGVNIPWIKCS